MVFALGKFTPLNWLRLLSAFAKTTMQEARRACVLSVEGDISLPRLEADTLYDNPLVFVPSFRRCHPFDFERDRTEFTWCQLSNANASQAMIFHGFEDAFDSPTHRYDLEPQTKDSKPHHLSRGSSVNNIGETFSRSNTSSFCSVFRKDAGKTVRAFLVPFKQAQTSGVYYPELLNAMRLAFDLAWNRVSLRFDDPETARRILAKQILHHADRGQRKVGGLATAAADDLLALTGASGDRPS